MLDPKPSDACEASPSKQAYSEHGKAVIVRPLLLNSSDWPLHLLLGIATAQQEQLFNEGLWDMADVDFLSSEQPVGCILAFPTSVALQVMLLSQLHCLLLHWIAHWRFHLLTWTCAQKEKGKEGRESGTILSPLGAHACWALFSMASCRDKL